jgi:ribokinase
MTHERKLIVVVGSINMDLVARAPRLPLAGQTLIGTAFETTPGGKGANQAVVAARLGFPVRMIGMVGASAAPGPDPSSPAVSSPDIFGQALLGHLAAAGVDTSAVERVAGPSGVAQILVAESGENIITVIPGANGKMDCAAIDRHAPLIRSAGIVLCQFELPLETTLYTLALCHEAGVPIMLDPAPAAPLPDEAWSRIAWFTPNETEAAFYLGESITPEEGAKRLLARGLHGVVLKRGAAGAYVAVAGGDAAWARPFLVEAVDTVAAGDCFNGAFAVALLEGCDPWQAARFANAAAAISVTRRGAQAAMPSRLAVEAFLSDRR